ncbi:MAG TPA: 3-phosphoshikimate 1-carboxyvinyltransferase, partial [Alphaproteobacteria bacterium]|nr:3-phosphoshikimate 1-carboxyvinyltransferase [Alphaproteobacteria bacterium]
MFARRLALRPLAAERPPWLRGTLWVPGDAIVAHLALCAAALARGESVIAAVPQTSGLLATAAALGELGAHCERHEGRWHLAGLGAGGLLAPRRALDFAHEALGLELIMGLCAPYDFPARFTADPDLSARPFPALLERLSAFGTAVTEDDRGRLPISLHGPPVAMPVELDLPPAAPATKAALLLAALGAPGRSVFVEPAPGWDHAERLLASFGGPITVERRDDGSRRITVGGLPALAASRLTIPGDPLAASLGLLAASIVPASELRIERVLVNPARTGFFSALLAMGADVEVHDLDVVAHEEVADLAVRHAPLHGITLAAGFIEANFSQLPLLAVAAACAEG